MKDYNHKQIEKKWQDIWAKKKIFLADDKSKKPKFYGLIEFPYPSGEGLHVGHIRSNTAMDVISRKRRMEGFNVLYPIGWDAFGLPTENYAIKTGIHPTIVTKKNTDTFRKQLKELGFSFDWSREINTTDPKYYKWTQWIFLQFLKHGLAYKKKMPINWCPKDKIGLANEEVVDGKCERCGTPVEKKDKEQWMLAITKYADRLDKDLDSVDFLEKIKIQQRNWIGKSDGAEIEFKLNISTRVLPKKILIGTKNPAKIKMVKDAFPKALNIEFVSLDNFPNIDDSNLVEGDDFRENARRKSEFYFKKTGLPTISTDHILWVEKYQENNGFIVHIRKLANPNSPRATDQEVGEWVENFVKQNGESKSAFHYAVSFTDKGGTIDFVTKQNEYILQSEKSPKKNEGYVFDRYLKDIETGELRVEQQFQKGFGRFNEFVNNEFLRLFSEQKIKVFTTRPDTLFGATYLVLAPEHPFITHNSQLTTNNEEITKYIKQAKEKTEMERTEEEKEKTGVELKGIKAINPANNEEIPVWIADYVLADYGTGAIMAVPAHDERDFQFAKKYNLPIRVVVKPESDFADMDQEKNRKFAEELFLLSRKNAFTMVLVGGMARSALTKDRFGVHSDVDIFVDKNGWDWVKDYLVEKDFKYKESNRGNEKGKHSWKNHISLWKDDAGVWLDMFLLEEKDGEYFDNVTDRKFIWGSREVFEEKKLNGVVFLIPKIAILEKIYQNLSSSWTDCFVGDGILTNSNMPKVANEVCFEQYTEPGAIRKDLSFVEREAITAIVKHWSEDKYLGLKWKKVEWQTFITGGVEKGQTPEQAAIAEILEETGYKNPVLKKELGRTHSKFFHVPKNENRFAHFHNLYFELKNEEMADVSGDEKAKHEVVWLTRSEVENFLTPEGHRYSWRELIGDFNGMKSEEAKQAITEFVGGKKVTKFKLRDWVFSRQHYWGEPIPVVFCEHCKNVKQKVLMIHGFEGRADGNWFPWMKTELEKRGFEVMTPMMTTADHPNLEQWMKELMPLVKDFGPNDIIIGHSLGSKAALHLLLKEKKRIKHLYLVGSTIGTLEKRNWDKFRTEWKNSDIDSLKKFWEEPIVLENVNKFVEQVTLILSDDDPWIPKSTHENLPRNWNFKEWKKFGHFDGKFIPELLELFLESKNDGIIPIPEKDLPVELPKVEKYQPTDSGESPLAGIKKWVNTKCPVCGGPARRETDTMPNWAGSSWYYLRYIDPHNNKTFVGKEKLDYWCGASEQLKVKSDELKVSPVDWYNGGMEHTTLHLLYSRFWHKFLFDLGLVPTSEPYQKRTSHGLILAEGGVKMSKSKGNVINPDDLVKRFGADSLRVYEMFMGPFDQAIAWNTDGLVGTSRFLEKVWRIGEKVKSQKEKVKSEIQNSKLENLAHKTIKKVGEDIESMHFNTAISSLMICANEMDSSELVPKELFEMYIKVLSPFAPHIAEELWQNLSHKGLLSSEKWPEFDSTKIVEDVVTIIVQVNGKVRGQFSASLDIAESDAIEKAKTLPEIKKWLENKSIRKEIFVKGRLVNLVV